MTRIGIESAFEVLQRARALEAQGKNIVHLEIGQPDFPTPAHVKEAAKRALDEGWTGYGPTPGFPDFRQAIAEYISTSRGISVTGQNVVVVPGGKPIMFFSMLAVVEPGDEVIYPNPGFPIYESVINFLGATPVPMPRLREMYSAMASRKSGNPGVGPYPVHPSSSAFFAASFTCCGVGKSGWPISRWTIVLPCASSARARCRTSKADSMPIRAMLSANFI